MLFAQYTTYTQTILTLAIYYIIQKEQYGGAVVSTRDVSVWTFLVLPVSAWVLAAELWLPPTVQRYTFEVLTLN